MHDNPRATEEEQELAHGDDTRLEEEESMRGGEFHDPDEEQRRARKGDDEA